MRPHPVCTAEYIEKIMLPAAQAGAAKTGRDPGRFAVAIKPLIATARTDEELEKRIRDIRARVAFYCSTPGYRAAFEFHGLGDLAKRMSVLSREQRWVEMPGMIDDEVLHLYATIGSFKEIGRKLHDRYAHVVTHAEFSIPIASDADRDTLAGLIRDLKAG